MNDVTVRPAATRGLPLVLFVMAATVEIVAVAADLTVLQWIAKPLLAPLLIWSLVQGRKPDLVVAALAFATAGDIALLVPGQVAFLTGMLFFLGTQICLISAFLRRTKPRAVAVVFWALLWVTANALLWNQLGALRVPVLFYSLALTAMAAAAAGVGRVVAAGGALFVISDLLIGVGAAGAEFPARDVLVMATYIAALALITVGWQRQDQMPGVMSPVAGVPPAAA
ncbi:putative membrane protein YhhN [Actinoplanes lutulentus]|uniref:Putative membrane protein YhhN n=1 Tax=Actinoplanes lutulentus TaxID=1287878 RepID=A0A327Z7R7_9ACTN|nr:lysoplasmalogenase [Actinoplanes lutulentus]MBB2948454.1 putative membrane protein YhhN [Actinoplanes lutulentus]RAK34513.1 putative membrane protein YhhN [Actinoplanes lutulentus]